MGKYNIGFLWGDFEDIYFLEQVLNMIKECKKMVIGLFTDEFHFRLYNQPVVHAYAKREEMLLQYKFVEKIIPVDWHNFSVHEICNSLKREHGIAIDSIFIGSEYGKLYQSDLKYCASNNIHLLGTEIGGLNIQHLKQVLNNTYVDYKVVLFGTGRYFDIYMSELGEQYPPDYAIDNDKGKWGTKKAGVEIKAPEELKNDLQEHRLVIICARNSDDMVNQLIEMGDFDYRRMNYGNELAVYDEWRVELRDEVDYLKKINELLLELLLEFDRVCTKYNLPYFLNCGSAIGAVRHHGFIPWDDDVDVAMFQWDYDVLKKHADEIWPEGSDYKLVEPIDLGNGAFLDFLNRLMCVREHVDNNIFDKVKGKADDSVLNTANLDIYILNNASESDKKQQRNVMILKAIYGLGMGHRAFVDYETYKKFDRFTRFVVRITSTVGRFIPLSLIVKLHEHFARRFDRKDAEGCYESNGYATTFVFDKNILGSGKRIEVCGHQLMVAEQVEKYLEQHGYVNFMTYPPANHWKPSHAVKSPDLV